jgi:predicted acyl esterase
MVPGVGAATREAWSSRPPRDPLVRDSLEALDSLISRRSCTTKDAADGDTTNGVELPYRFCDDGVPPPGGGANGIPVPVAYHRRHGGDDYRGLPRPASRQEAAAAAAKYDLRPERGRRITLDVDVTLPPAGMRPPRGGFPVLVFMHGCCGGDKTAWEAPTVHGRTGEQWHHNNSWFAIRGYVVVTYTARGFRSSEDRGSTGTTQLDSRRFEINDYQYLAGLLVDHDWARRTRFRRPIFNVNPHRIAAVGGSYGGGFSWLALTDPKWRSPAYGREMKLRTAVPKYGWTDIVEALLPAGHYFDRKPGTVNQSFVAPSKIRPALSRDPIGVEKKSIVTGLYVSGNLAATNHTTFPDYFHEAYARVDTVGDPYDGDPTVERPVKWFLKDRSAYFQRSFWRKVRNGVRVPLYIAAPWADPLFPTIENVRFYNKLISIDEDYPVKMYVGDYGHFTANKPKEWGDLCGADHHVCTLDDYRRADGSLRLFRKAPTRARRGINTQIDKFLARFLLRKGPRPAMNVTATTTLCPVDAGGKYPADEPGIEYRASSWRRLAPRLETFRWQGGGITTTEAVDRHGLESDPVGMDRRGQRCYTTDLQEAGPGVVQYVSDPLAKSFTTMGMPRLTLGYDTPATNYWIAARVFDRGPDGSSTLVNRGVCRVNTLAAPRVDCNRFELWGNGWRFAKGHRVVLELSQSYTPMFRRNNFPSAIDFHSAELELPVVPERLRRDFRD